MSELQAWVLIGAASLSAVGTVIRAWIAWQEWRKKWARVANKSENKGLS